MKQANRSAGNTLFLAVAALFVGHTASADFVSVCDRTPQIRNNLVQQLKKSCETITASDLATIIRIAVPKTNLTRLTIADLSSLPHLGTLNVKRNHLTELVPGIFAQLPELKVLVILGNDIKALPDDFLEGNEKIERVHIFQNPYHTISETIFARLATLKHLTLLDVDLSLNAAEKQRLAEMFPLGSQVVVNYN